MPRPKVPPMAFKGKVWKYSGPAGWHFVYASDGVTAKVKKAKRRTVGFGYVPVRATVGKTSWKTTLFPTKEGPYLLSIKAEVRRREGIAEGKEVRVALSLL